MRTTFSLLLASALVLAAASCASRQKTETDCRDAVESPAARTSNIGGSAGAPERADYQFACYAAVNRLATVAYGLLAEKRAQSQVVRGYARQLVEENKEAYASLEGLARQQNGMVMPTRLDEAHAAVRAQLGALQGDAFDRAYLQAQIREDDNAIDLYQRELKAGNEPFLKHFAANSLVKTRADLVHARQIAAEIGLPSAQPQ